MTACAFLRALIEAVPYRIHTVLTDNGVQFSDPPRYRNGPTATSWGTCSIASAPSTASSTA